MLDVIEQHAQEAAFCWLLRAAAVKAPHYTLRNLARLDTRIEAHIDGLRVAGSVGWEKVLAELSWREPGEVFSAALLAFESGDPSRIEPVLAMTQGKLELERGIISALAWLPHETARPHVERLLLARDSRRRIGLRAAALHRWVIHDAFVTALGDTDPETVSVTLRAVGEVHHAPLLRHCVDHLDSQYPSCRFWAAWSLGSMDRGDGLEVLREVAASDDPQAQRAIDVAAALMSSKDVRAWHRSLSREERTRRAAIRLARSAGHAELVPWLIEQMTELPLARSSGEAFEMISGADLALNDLETDYPDSFDAGPTEEPDSEDVAMDPDEDLPWPEPVQIERWWQQNRQRFAGDVRYLLGQPITASWARHVLREGRQRHRAAAAFEFARMEPDRALFEIRAPGFRQEHALR